MIVLLTFCSVFFARVLEHAGAPAPINFLHFVTVPFACGVVLAKSRLKDPRQITIVQQLLIGLFILLTITLISAILNDAGIINAVLSFMLLGEPFIFLMTIIAVPMPHDSFKMFQTWIRRFCLFHIVYALAQRYILRFDLVHTGMEPEDNIQGVFFLSGAGHVVGTSVSLSFGLYYLMNCKDVPILFRVFVALAAFTQMLAADGKQVLLALLLAWILLIVLELGDIIKVIQYAAGAAIVGLGGLWAIENVPAFGAFGVWLRPEIFGADGEATLLKTAAFRIVPTYYESALNWVFGLGPGHTVGRLGGWMLHIYSDLLDPLGSTRHEASKAVWRAVGESWLGGSSSLFSPLFGWAGIWGDLGLAGLAAYFFLAYTVWRYICKDDCSKILVLSIFVFGLIFSQLEEPGYMLTIAAILGLRWHEQNGLKKQIDSSSSEKRGWFSWL